MSSCLEVVHLAAHLGGGVGKALSGLVSGAGSSASRVRHRVLCLERPEKTQFAAAIERRCEVIVAPDRRRLLEAVAAADVVQLEWWHHPATMAALCEGTGLPPMRLLLWCHVSGLHTPIFPPRLLESAHACLFTSPCSLVAPEVKSLAPEHRRRAGVV
jgi:hypothetical protein